MKPLHLLTQEHYDDLNRLACCSRQHKAQSKGSGSSYSANESGDRDKQPHNSRDDALPSQAGVELTRPKPKPNSSAGGSPNMHASPSPSSSPNPNISSHPSSQPYPPSSPYDFMENPGQSAARTRQPPPEPQSLTSQFDSSAGSGTEDQERERDRPPPAGPPSPSNFSSYASSKPVSRPSSRPSSALLSAAQAAAALSSPPHSPTHASSSANSNSSSSAGPGAATKRNSKSYKVQPNFGLDDASHSAELVITDDGDTRDPEYV